MEEELEVWSEKEIKVFNHLKDDFKGAKKAKKEIDDLIANWNDIYEGKFTKKARKNRSKLVMKEVAKQIEWQRPELTEPFISTSHPIRITSAHEDRARIQQKYINSEFAGRFERDDFIDQLVDVVLREGTAWVRTGWERVETTVKMNYPNMSMEEILGRKEDPSSLEPTDNPQEFNVTYDSIKVRKNEPTAVVERNENCFPDPSARTRDELRFFAVRKFKTLSELKETGFYDEEALDQLKEDNDENNRGDESSLASQRDDDNERYGGDNNFKMSGKGRGKIAIIEYWGFYDLDKSGTAEPIICEWAETSGVNLRLEENPYPSKEIPFWNTVYSKRPFSLWGNAIAFFVGDNQDIKSGLMRGVMDNLSQANNGQRFFQRGALDYTNFKKMRNGDRDIVMNKSPKDAFIDGNFNQLPASVMQTLEMVNKETKDLAGTPNGGEQSRSGTGKEDEGKTLTMAQSRMNASVRSLGNLLSKVMKEWLTMAEVFLDNAQIEALFTSEEQQTYKAFKGTSDSFVKVKVGTAVGREIKLKQLNMLMQQSKALGETIQKEDINALVAEMFEEFDMFEKAEKLRSWKQPPPSPQQQQMQMLELQKAKLEVDKLNAEIAKIGTDAQLDQSKSINEQADAQATIMYKQAQTDEKNAKAQKTRMDTAMTPIQVQTEASKVNQTKKE